MRQSLYNLTNPVSLTITELPMLRILILYTLYIHMYLWDIIWKYEYVVCFTSILGHPQVKWVDSRYSTYLARYRVTSGIKFLWSYIVYLLYTNCKGSKIQSPFKFYSSFFNKNLIIGA